MNLLRNKALLPLTILRKVENKGRGKMIIICDLRHVTYSFERWTFQPTKYNISNGILQTRYLRTSEPYTVFGWDALIIQSVNYRGSWRNGFWVGWLVDWPRSSQTGARLKNGLLRRIQNAKNLRLASIRNRNPNFGRQYLLVRGCSKSTNGSQ